MSDVDVESHVDSHAEPLGLTWLASRYQVAGLRARGALCLVYQGQDAVLQRPVAIKAPLPSYVEHYRATLAVTSLLPHPAFLALYDVIEQGDGLFLAYEFVEGRPLAEYITTGLPLRRALDVILQVARALAYAHAHGVAHGDLTPSAVLVDRAAQARVANVGLPPDDAYFDETATSAFASGVADDPDLTAARLTERVEWLDTWSAAALLWQLVTDMTATREGDGRTRAFRADTPEGLRTLLDRALRVSHPDPLATAEELEASIAGLVDQLESSLDTDEPMPAAIVAMRAERRSVNQASTGAEIPSVRWRHTDERAGMAAATTSYGAIEGADGHDGNTTQPAHERARAARVSAEPFVAPRPHINLPSRPLDAQSAHLLAARKPVGQARRRALGGWVWTVLLLALFTVCFLIGFSVMGVIPLPLTP